MSSFTYTDILTYIHLFISSDHLRPCTVAYFTQRYTVHAKFEHYTMVYRIITVVNIH